MHIRHILLRLLVVAMLAAPGWSAVTWNVTIDDQIGSYGSLYSSMIDQTKIAGATWADLITTANTTIDVKLSILDVISNRGSGRSGTTHQVGTVAGIRIYEQSAAWKLRSGGDSNGADPDVLIELDPNYINEQMWFDPSPLTRSVPVPNNRIDSMSVFLHELSHAIAMNGWRDHVTTALPAPGNFQSTYDQWITTVNGWRYFNGPSAMALYGGPVPLNSNNLHHIGNVAGSPGSELIPDLMNGVVFNWGQRYYISPLDRAIIADTGVPISIPEPTGLAALVLLLCPRRRCLFTCRPRYCDFELNLRRVPRRRSCDTFPLMPEMTIQQAIELAMQHHRSGQLAQAEAIYRQVLAVQPQQSDAMQLLGLIVAARGQTDEAIDLISRATRIAPDVADYHYNLAQVLRSAERYEQACESYERALALRSDFYEAANNLSAVLLRRGCIDDALAAARKAVAIRPGAPEGYVNVGIALYDAGKLEEAITAYREALAISPDYPAARFNLAAALMALGRMEEGWSHYEARWSVPDATVPPPRFAKPRWDGRLLHGQRILIWPEQGFGDTVLAARYLQMVAGRGGKVILAAPPEMKALLQSAKGVEQVVDPTAPQVPFDVHCPLMSLPGLFKTTLGTIPADIPYLFADPALVQKWRSRLGDAQGKLRVGLAWAGNPQHKRDTQRSMSLASLAPLAGISGIQFISLQKGKAAEPAKSGPPGLSLIDHTSELTDFAETAALMETMDLVITIDTVIAHLAGAVGKPVWTLLPFAPDWRWLRDRSDCPWYPTMRLFRQPRPGDWQTPLQQAAGALRELAANR